VGGMGVVEDGSVESTAFAGIGRITFCFLGGNGIRWLLLLRVQRPGSARSAPIGDVDRGVNNYREEERFNDR